MKMGKLLRNMRWMSTVNSRSTVQALEDTQVMDHIVCPISKYALVYRPEHGDIICPEIRVVYPIRDGIPILVPSEGRLLNDDEQI